MTAAGALRPLPVYYAAKPPVVELSLDFPCNSQGLRAPAAIPGPRLPSLQLRVAAGACLASVALGFPAALAVAGDSRGAPRLSSPLPSCSLPCSLAFGVVRAAPPKGEYGRGFACAKIRGFWPAIRVLARSEPILGRSGALSSRTEFADLGFSRARASSCVERGRVVCQSAVSWPKIGDFRARSGACSDGASLSVALESAEKGARFKRKDGEGRSPRTEGRGGALALSEGAGRGRARARLRVGVRGEARRRLRRLPGRALRCGGLSPRPAEGTLRAAMGAFGIVRVAAILVPSGGFGCCRKKGGDGV